MNVTVFNPPLTRTVVISTDGASSDTRSVFKQGDLGITVPIVSGNIPSTGTIELFRKSDGAVLYSFDETTGHVENVTTTTLEELYQALVVVMNGV